MKRERVGRGKRKRKRRRCWQLRGRHITGATRRSRYIHNKIGKYARKQPASSTRPTSLFGHPPSAYRSSDPVPHTALSSVLLYRLLYPLDVLGATGKRITIASHERVASIREIRCARFDIEGKHCTVNFSTLIARTENSCTVCPVLTSRYIQALTNRSDVAHSLNRIRDLRDIRLSICS